MKEIRIHARAGQGAITTSVLMAMAAFEEGKKALAFPHFGAERMGAPMNAFLRLAEGDEEIRIRSQITDPDYIIVLDSTLLEGFNVAEGLKPEGAAVINSTKKPEDLGLETEARIYTVPATEIALETIGRPFGNTALIGAFAAATGEMGIEAVINSVKARFPGRIGEANAQAAQKAYDYIKGGSQ